MDVKTERTKIYYGKMEVRDVRTKPSVKDGIVSEVVRDGVRRLKYEPGNGWSYNMIIVPLAGLGVPGTGDGEENPTKRVEVVLLDWGVKPGNSSVSFNIELGAGTHPTYIREKLGVGLNHAVALAELFEVLGNGPGDLSLERWIKDAKEDANS